jgi:hypothetical protein
LCYYKTIEKAKRGIEMFNLIWNNETIDSFNTREEAEKMANEYSVAYNGPVAIVEVEDEWEDDYDYDDSMDGDHESALASCGWGTDEDYGYYGDGDW